MNQENKISSQDVVIQADALRLLSSQLYQKVGVPKEDADIVSHLQVETDLRGIHSHGTRALPGYVRTILAGRINPTPNIRIVNEGPSSGSVDGDGGLGHLVSVRAMNLAIEKAKVTGIAAVGACNSNHYGAASCFSMMALKHGMIGFSVSSSGPGVAPYGGMTRVMGNHPFSYAIPTKNEPPIVIDMACGVSAWGRVATMAMYGEKLSPGWALDENGKETDDPSKARVLLPMGGVKGYALAVVMDALSGPLIGEIATCHRGIPEYAGRRPPGNSSHFFYAINVSNFVPLDEFTEEMDKAIQTIRASRPAEGFDRVYLPGEIEWLKSQKWRKEGIPLHHQHVKSLVDLAKELSIEVPWV
ncbi:Ldh family oxidoreductase [Candidatus Poribacteria bacterium]|nr:Ldh family oxidoreductase [Candidatus Poribacteria bacterium]